MAGDWIKMRVNLWTHPKVVRIASALKRTRCAVIGALHGAWSVFDQHADVDSGGEAGLSMSKCDLDALIETEGMADAMQAVGWLSEHEGTLYLPRYQEHNGATAKRRASETKRKQDSRSIGADSPQSVRKASASKRTRTEQNRGEENPEKTDHFSISEKESIDTLLRYKEHATQMANRVRRCLRNGDSNGQSLPGVDSADWKFVIDACTLAARGDLTEHDVIDAAEGVKASHGSPKPSRNPVGHFRAILTERIGPQPLAKLLASITLDTH